MSESASYIHGLLSHLGFAFDGTLWQKKYKTHSDYLISVNVEAGLIDYGSKIDLGAATTSNLSQPENLVVLECVNRLLEKGYRPNSLTLEKTWKLGRSGKSGRADITVSNHGDGHTLFIIECKTWGQEFQREKHQMQGNGGQLFSYRQQDYHCRYLCLYTSVFEYRQVRYENAIVRLSDDPKLVEQYESGARDIKLFRDAGTAGELHAAWKESYACYFHPNGIFDEEAQAYAIELKPLKLKDLRRLEEGDGGFIHNQFAEILRHNNISDRENAFNKMISLFLCKVVDENKSEIDVMDFQWKEGVDTYEDLQDRLQRLYQIGMQDYLKEDVIYFENDYVEKAFCRYKKAVAKDKMVQMLRALKFYTNNELAFKEVHNEALFIQNAKVLNEVVQLIQPFRIKYSHKEQFLGNLFELLLNTGVKQSEGQFFTPIPIVGFIIASLPLAEQIAKRQTRGEVHRLPRVIDYACGSGHFITEAIGVLQETAKKLALPEGTDTRWTRDYVFGIERDYRLARVAKIACFMNGAGDANIIYGDGLETHAELGVRESFDILIANPPYAIKDFKQHLSLEHNNFDLLDVLTDSSSEIEILFVERIKQLLKPSGMAGVILPSSILSNGGAYARAREVLFRHFEIKGIVELGGGTFIATNTNTVILFLKKRIHGDFTHFTYRAEAIFDEGRVFDGEYQDEHLLRGYCGLLDIEYEDYLDFLNDNKDPTSQPKLTESELYRNYQDAFNALKETIKYRASRAFRSQEEADQEHDLSQRFRPFLLEREKKKFIHYCLAHNQEAVIVKAGAKDVEKEFLGYEWSKRRGYEGMRETGPGKLFDSNDPYNSEKASSYIRRNFLGELLDEEQPEGIRGHVSIVRLADLLDFEDIAFDLRINIGPELPESTKYPSVRFNTAARLKYGKGLPKKKRKKGQYPVLGSNGIDGYHNEYLVKGPAIIVGRKGSAGKVTYVESNCFPIDTTFWLEIDPDYLLPKFAYWLLKWLDLSILVGRKGMGVPGLNRTDVHKSRIPAVPIADQRRFLTELNSVDDGLKDADTRKLAILDGYLR